MKWFHWAHNKHAYGEIRKNLLRKQGQGHHWQSGISKTQKQGREHKVTIAFFLPAVIANAVEEIEDRLTDLGMPESLWACRKGIWSIDCLY